METSDLKQTGESQHMVGADRFASMFPLRDSFWECQIWENCCWMLDFSFRKKSLLADHPSMKKDFRAVRWKAKDQMHNELLSWLSFWVTAFTRKVGMQLYLSLNLQLRNEEEIWISVQLSICNTWKSDLVWFFSPKVARTREWGVLTNNSVPNVFAFGKSTAMKESLVIPSSPNKNATNLLDLCNWA